MKQLASVAICLLLVAATPGLASGADPYPRIDPAATG